METQVFLAHSSDALPMFRAVSSALGNLNDLIRSLELNPQQYDCHELVKTNHQTQPVLLHCGYRCVVFPYIACQVGRRITQFNAAQPVVLVRKDVGTQQGRQNDIPVRYPCADVITAPLPLKKETEGVVAEVDSMGITEKAYSQERAALFNLVLISYWNKAEERRQQRVLSQRPDEVYQRFTNLTAWKQAVRSTNINLRRAAAKVLTTFESLGILAHCKLTCLVRVAGDILAHADEAKTQSIQFKRGSVYIAYQLSDMIKQHVGICSPVFALNIASYILASQSAVCQCKKSLLNCFDFEQNMMIFLVKDNYNGFVFLVCHIVASNKSNDQYLSHLIFDKVLDDIPSLPYTYEIVDVLPLQHYEIIRPLLSRQQGFSFIEMAVDYARSIQFSSDSRRQFNVQKQEIELARHLSGILNAPCGVQSNSNAINVIHGMNVREILALAYELNDELLVAFVHCLNITNGFLDQFSQILVKEIDLIQIMKSNSSTSRFIEQAVKLLLLLALHDKDFALLQALLHVNQVAVLHEMQGVTILGLNVASVLAHYLSNTTFRPIRQSHSNFLFVNKYPKIQTSDLFVQLQKNCVIPSDVLQLGQGEITKAIVYVNCQELSGSTQIRLMSYQICEAPAFDDIIQEFLEIPQSSIEFASLPAPSLPDVSDVILSQQSACFHPLTLLYSAVIGGVKRLIHQATLIVGLNRISKAFVQAVEESAYYILNSQYSTFNNFLGLCGKIEIDCYFKGKITPFEAFDFEKQLANKITGRPPLPPALWLQKAQSYQQLLDYLEQYIVQSEDSVLIERYKHICGIRAEIRCFLELENDNTGQAPLNVLFQQLYELEHALLADLTGSSAKSSAASISTPLFRTLSMDALPQSLLGQELTYSQIQALQLLSKARPQNVAIMCNELEISAENPPYFDD